MDHSKPFSLLFVGDLHHQEQDRDALLCSHALTLWAQMVGRKEGQPRAYFQVGDLIDGYKLTDEVCRRDAKEAAKALTLSPVPVYPILGNHETCWLPDRNFHAKNLNIPNFSRVIEAGPLRIVLFDITVDRESYGELTPSHAAWLKDALATQRPTIVMQHQLIHGDDEICSHRHYVRNSGEYRRLLSDFPNLCLIVTGHRHIPTLTILKEAHGLPQVTLSGFCVYPFTLGELTVDPQKKEAVLRERGLEDCLESTGLENFKELLHKGHQLVLKQHKDVWLGRNRFTPELSEVSFRWR